MKKNFKSTMIIFIMAIILTIAIPGNQVYAFTDKNQAPNMYVTWPAQGNYSYMTVDFYCEKDTEGTYWAVHNWDGGYAGFQNADGEHKILLAIWDSADGTKKPEIEYLSNKADRNSLDFTGEGTGKHVFTNYNWQAGKKYSMCVGLRTVNGKSQYAQWVREENGPWLLTAIISYPEANLKFHSDVSFQEDYKCNNLLRKCRLSNAAGYNSDNNTWEAWKNCTLSNSLFTDPNNNKKYIENVNYDCDWGTENSGSYVWVQSGGNTDSNGKTLPVTSTVIQNTLPTDFPKWNIDILGDSTQIIQSNYSNLYVVPSGNKVVQGEEQYKWNFIHSDDGYFYICTSDNAQAVTLSGTNYGDDLVLQSFNGADNQKWSKEEDENGHYYLYPKLDLSSNMDIEGPSMQTGAAIQIWPHDTSTAQFKWNLLP